MAVIEATGLQQVLSLSNVAEKLQQSIQHRPDQIHQNFVTDIKNQDDLKKSEIPQSNPNDEAMLRDEYAGKGGIKYKHRPRKDNRKKNNKMEAEEEKTQLIVLAGKFVDITI